MALDVQDLEFCDEGVRVTIRRSKTDQEGAGAVVAVCRGSIACPVEPLAYLHAAAIESGPVFRRILRGGHFTEHRLDAQTVRKIVKEHAAKLGLNPKDFGGHSLRAGFATSSATRGANLFRIMDVTRHKDVNILKRYVRNADLFKDHAAAGLL
jgi:integrase